MLLSKTAFKLFLMDFGFVKMKREDDAEVYFDDGLFGDFWVYLSGDCPEEYSFYYDGTNEHIDLTDFLRKAIEHKEIAEDDRLAEIAAGDDWG